MLQTDQSYRSSLNKLRHNGMFRGFPYVFLRDAVQIKGVGELSNPLIQYEQDSKMKQRLTIFMISMMVSGTLGSFFELLRHRAIEHKKDRVSDSIKAVCHHVMTTQKSHRPFFLIYPLIISIKTAFFLPRSLNKDHQNGYGKPRTGSWLSNGFSVLFNVCQVARWQRPFGHTNIITKLTRLDGSNRCVVC